MKGKKIKVDTTIKVSVKKLKEKKAAVEEPIFDPVIDPIDEFEEEFEEELEEVVDEKKPLTQDEIDSLLANLSDYCKNATKFHLEQIKVHTDEILVTDVMYCIELTERMLKKKKAELKG